MKKSTTLIIILIVISLVGAVGFWFIYMRTPVTTNTNTSPTTDLNTFSPFTREPITTSATNNNQNSANTSSDIQNSNPQQLTLPKLRQLSITPVGGMGVNASVIRFIDRGTGHVYEANSTSAEINKLSNTTIPKIYESYWNKDLNALVIRYIKDDSDTITNFYAELKSTAYTGSSTTPFEMKGKYLSPDIAQIAISPAKDKIFTWNIENGRGIGYLSGFDEKGKIKVIDTPLTQVVIDWPEKNTVSYTTKASANASGFTYITDVKNGMTRKVIGGIRGLFSKINTDKTKVIYSQGGINDLKTFLLDMKDGSIQDVLLKTLTDKCTWSVLRKNEAYCAVPTEIPNGIYPDDWYKGNISFIDQIWHIDTTTGEVHLLANLLELSDKLIDATKLMLDPKENTLYFVNKRDLTLWALDLNQ